MLNKASRSKKPYRGDIVSWKDGDRKENLTPQGQQLEEENISQDVEDRMLTWIPLHVEFGRVQSRPKSERDGTTRCLFVEAASLLGPRYPGRKPTVTKLDSNAVYYRSANIGKQQKEGASRRGAKWMKQHVNQATLLRKGYHAANWI